MSELPTNDTETLLVGQRDVLAELARGAPLRTILSKIAHYSETCTPDMQASILWYEPETGKLRRGGHARLPDSFADGVDGLVPGPQSGSCGTAAFTRARTITFDVQLDPLWTGFRDFAAQYSIRSAWSTPLISPIDQSLLGVFGMYYPDTRGPSPEDLARVDHFTHLAAIALERHRRDSALAASEKRRQDALLALTVGIAHELNTPLGVARTASMLAEERIAAINGVDAAKPREALALVRDNLDRGLGLLRAFHSSMVSEGRSATEEINLADNIGRTVQSLAPALNTARIVVEFNHGNADALMVRGSTVRMNQVFTTLLNNAAKHAYQGAGGVVRISIGRALLRPEFAEIIVEDSGVGMTDEIAGRCTDPFFSTDRSQNRSDLSGSGLGLFLARHAVETELGGQLLLNTKPGAGVRWTILLPALATH